MAPSTELLERSFALEEQIRKLNAIGIALSGEQRLEELLELIVKEARSFTGADGGSLYIKEDNRLNFLVAQTESLERRDGHNRQAFKSLYLPLSKESIAGYVALTGEILNIEDVYDIPPTCAYRVNKQFDRQNNYRSKSMLVVPMRDHTNAIIGVLQLINSLNGEGEVVPFKREYEGLVLSLASQAAVAIRNVKLIEAIRNLFRSLVRYSAKAIDARSPHTAGHSGRVARYCVRIAEAINEETEGRFGKVYFTPQEIEELHMAGWLHDIGKIGVRESVLEKTTKLSEAQMQVIEERFEAIKRSVQHAYLQKRVDAQLAGDASCDLPRLEKELARSLRQIEDDLVFLRRVNSPGMMKEEDCVRLHQIAGKTYTTVSGETRPYLTPEEYRHLSVVKGNLTAEEYKEMQAHVEHTIRILNKIPFTDDLKNIPKYA
ncbi:MAG: GAF domain-containing protein, partial [Calditrichaeota bacterium]